MEVIQQQYVQKLELYISCRGLVEKHLFEKCYPYVQVFVQDQQLKHFQQLAHTEVEIHTRNPDFEQSIVIDYIFETQQHLRFDVWDRHSPSDTTFVGSVEATLARIIGSRGQTCEMQLRDPNKPSAIVGKIIVRAERQGTCNDLLELNLTFGHLPDHRWFSTTKAFLRIYRQQSGLLNAQGAANQQQLVLVEQTGPQAPGINPVFPLLQLHCQHICNGDYNVPLRLEVWDYHTSNNHEYLCATEFTVNQLFAETFQNLQPLSPTDLGCFRRVQLANPKDFNLNTKEGKAAGTMRVSRATLIQRPSFVDYLRGGSQLTLVTAIDFTGSNGHPLDNDSHHFICPTGRLNHYQKAIVEIGEILVHYTHDNRIPVYGFGAQPQLPHFMAQETLHCFPINGYPDNPYVDDGIPGLMEAYKYLLPNVQFSGPTLFHPILEECMKLATQSKLTQDSDNYYIFLILTDGQINDMKETIDDLVACSLLPLSVVIVGIGHENFSNMHILNGQKRIQRVQIESEELGQRDIDDDENFVYEPLTDSKGNRALRKLVEFVPFVNYHHNPSLLAKEVLDDLPDEILNYYQLVGRAPKPAIQVAIGSQGIQQPNQGFPQPQLGQQSLQGQQPIIGQQTFSNSQPISAPQPYPQQQTYSGSQPIAPPQQQQQYFVQSQKPFQ